MKNQNNRRMKLGSALIVVFSFCPVIILIFFRSNYIISFLKTNSPFSSPLKSSIQGKINNIDPFEENAYESIPVDYASAVISAQKGGEVTLADTTLSVNIPPGALDKDQKVGITRLSVLDQQGNTTDSVYKCEPEGLHLKTPIEMTFSIPYKYDPKIIEVAYFDQITQTWISSSNQDISPDKEHIIAKPKKLSRSRIRVILGKEFENDLKHGRATFYLESDAGNNYERLIDGRWQYVRRRSKKYRNLMRNHRTERQNLLEEGVLRAITGARPEVEIFKDERFSIAMPADCPAAKTGWVKISRLDHTGKAMGYEIIARVNDYGPGLQARRCGVIMDVTKAVAEGLGLVWGKDFGVTGYKNNVAYMKVKESSDGKISRYLHVCVEAVTPDFEKTL